MIQNSSIILHQYQQLSHSVSVSVFNESNSVFIKKFPFIYYLNDYCVFIEDYSNVKKFIESKLLRVGIFGAFFHASDITISFLDSKSLYLTYLSSLELSESTLIIKASLKYAKYLEAPYKPSCKNLTRDIMKSASKYSQNSCYKECINNLIYKKFNCKLINGNINVLKDEMNCHPLFIPFINE